MQQHHFFPIMHNVLHIEFDILPALPVQQEFQPYSRFNFRLFSLGQSFFLQINTLIRNPAFFEITFRLLRIPTLFRTENLDIHEDVPFLSFLCQQLYATCTRKACFLSLKSRLFLPSPPK